MDYETQLELKLQSAEWAITETTRLLNEYKQCRTQNCKRLVEKKLRAIWGKLNYENNVLGNILQKAKDEGFEF